MRTALISDIHGNYEGLLAVLADIEQRQCERILCLGDLIDGGPDSIDVIRHLNSSGVLTVRGNHDEYIDPSLPSDVQAFLRALPENIIEGDIIYTHTSPRQKKRKVKDDIEAWNVFEETTYRRIFVGDVHVPMIWGQRCEQKVSATQYDIVYDEPFALAADDRYLVCVGAVGYSRDRHARLRYAIYDQEQDTITFQAPQGPLLTVGKIPD